MLEFIDSHAHYDDEKFDEDRDSLLEDIHNNKGVKRIINIGCTIERSNLSVELSKKHEHIYAAVGIHPEDVGDLQEDYLDVLRELSKNPKTVAIGEIGLDYHLDCFKEQSEKQKEVFIAQLELAKELSLPVVIHSRDATNDTLEILENYKNIGGVMHCFSGSADVAKIVLDYGFSISFTGVLTFKNAKKAIEALKVIPMDKLLVETDCPYMAPEPFRGSRCDSSMIVSVIHKIAEVKEISPQEVARITTENVYKVFPKLK